MCGLQRRCCCTVAQDISMDLLALHQNIEEFCFIYWLELLRIIEMKKGGDGEGEASWRGPWTGAVAPLWAAEMPSALHAERPRLQRSTHSSSAVWSGRCPSYFLSLRKKWKKKTSTETTKEKAGSISTSVCEMCRKLLEKQVQLNGQSIIHLTFFNINIIIFIVV